MQAKNFIKLAVLSIIVLHLFKEGEMTKTMGMSLVFGGAIMNCAVVFINKGKMPVRVKSAEQARYIIAYIKNRDSKTHAVMNRKSRLRWLGDIFYISVRSRYFVVSIGDIIQLVGITILTISVYT